MFPTRHTRARAGPARRRHEVDKEAQHVEEIHKRDSPLQNRRRIVVLSATHDAEPDSERDLDDDEGELDPEAEPQHAVLAEVDPEPLVLPADEDGAEHVANDEDGQEDVVESVVAESVEDGEQDQTRGAGDGGDERDPAVDFLPDGGVGVEFSGVAEPALEEEGEVEGYDCDGGHGDEEGFQAGCAHVWCGLVHVRMFILWGWIFFWVALVK